LISKAIMKINMEIYINSKYTKIKIEKILTIFFLIFNLIFVYKLDSKEYRIIFTLKNNYENK
jgi:hypothetical protein